MIKIIAVGKIKDKNLRNLCNEYLKRLRPYHRIEEIEVADEAISGTSEKDEIIVKDKEGARVLSKIKENEYVILLDVHGREMDSVELANHLSKIQTYTSSNITFVIGGSLGLSKDLIHRSNERLKLSKLTFLHQMTRLILLEQIYRSFKINHHEIYHK